MERDGYAIYVEVVYERLTAYYDHCQTICHSVQNRNKLHHSYDKPMQNEGGHMKATCDDKYVPTKEASTNKVDNCCWGWSWDGKYAKEGTEWRDSSDRHALRRGSCYDVDREIHKDVDLDNNNNNNTHEDEAHADDTHVPNDRYTFSTCGRWSKSWQTPWEGQWRLF